jgi:protein tyrosine/serine phosphatase
MTGLSKATRRVMKRVTLGWRLAALDHTPSWAKRAFGPAAIYLDMLFVDHGIFRVVYANRHRIGERAWRSAQPTPGQIAAFARDGIRTIVNLRGERLCGSYWLEVEACRRHGIELVDFQVRSRAAPSRAELRAARELFERIDYPMLMHCKSGADRAGLMSALFRIVKDGCPVAVAKEELGLKFGHIRQADTGILDYFFQRYLEDTRSRPMPFFEWVEKVYDPDELKRSFKAKGWANRLVDGVLRRE